MGGCMGKCLEYNGFGQGKLDIGTKKDWRGCHFIISLFDHTEEIHWVLTVDSNCDREQVFVLP